MKHKYSRKDKKVAKKSKTPKNAKKLVKAKKAARRSPKTDAEDIAAMTGITPQLAGTVEPIIIEPEALAESAQEAHEPIPGDPTEAV